MIRRTLRGIRRLGAWLVEHPVRIAVLLLAFVVGSVAGVPAGEAGFTYVWRDPAMCDDCHVHDYANEAWARSAHAGLTTCHDCHRVPLSHYPKNLVVTFSPPTEEEFPIPEVATVICEQCHGSGPQEEALTGPMTEATRARVVKVGESGLHKIHLEAKPEDGSEITCMSCHGGKHARAHRFEPSPEGCLECHDDHTPEPDRLAHTACRACHFAGFLGRNP